jgi:CheY-like chemotaxis protein
VLDKARALAGRLLTFSAAGKPVTEPRDLREIVERCARFVLSGSSVVGDLELPGDLWPCEVDAHQVGQALDNLLLNARQAMPQGGRIRLRAANVTLSEGQVARLSAGRYVRLEIGDEGGGIPPESQSRLFDPFFTTKPTGSGLGLTIVHSVISQHGGHIDFTSVVGRGTTFQIYLPASQQDATDAAPEVRTAGHLGGRILVMDDEPYVRDIAEEALAGLGYAVDLASDGAAALTLFARAQSERRPIALVILDLTIPGGMGGIETLARLRALDPHVKAIASSGYASDPVMAQPGSFGFDATLPKPYTIAALGDVVGELLDAQRPDSA